MITAEALEKANAKLATVPIKGKDYVQVTERIKAFRSICPSGRIETKIVSLENGVVTMMSEVFDDKGNPIATGFAQEKEANGYINKTSFIENCETSAVGRALGFAGIGIDASMASAEEVANAIINQGKDNLKPANNSPYPDRNTMLNKIAAKYPPGTKQEAALLAAFNITALEQASDAQLQAVYGSKIAKK